LSSFWFSLHNANCFDFLLLLTWYNTWKGNVLETYVYRSCSVTNTLTSILTCCICCLWPPHTRIWQVLYIMVLIHYMPSCNTYCQYHNKSWSHII
jgi:hypothetical protein